MSLTSAVAAQTVLIVTAGVLFYVGLADFRNYRIRNEVVLVLAGLYVLHALLSGRWTSAYWNVGFAVLMSAAMLYAYSMKLMGGGDLKLLAVAFLWTGPFCAIIFAAFLLIFIGLHVLAHRLRWVGGNVVDGRAFIPLAPSIAGALIVLFMTGCLHPV